MYYIIETRHLEAEFLSDKALKNFLPENNTDVGTIEVRTMPLKDNNNNIVNNGLFYTKNGFMFRALGSYKTVEAAKDAVEFMFQHEGLRSNDIHNDKKPFAAFDETDTSVVFVYKPGKYAPLRDNQIITPYIDKLIESMSEDDTLMQKAVELEHLTNILGYTLSLNPTNRQQAFENAFNILKERRIEMQEEGFDQTNKKHSTPKL